MNPRLKHLVLFLAFCRKAEEEKPAFSVSLKGSGGFRDPELDKKKPADDSGSNNAFQAKLGQLKKTSGGGEFVDPESRKKKSEEESSGGAFKFGLKKTSGGEFVDPESKKKPADDKKDLPAVFGEVKLKKVADE